MAQAAQERLRHNEAAKQASILDALPVSIALLDPRGLITSVNQTWRQFARANAIQESEYAVGVDYLKTCNRALGEGTSHAHQAACGIRSVLSGAVSAFSMEYPCHSLDRQRWLRVQVTPIGERAVQGAVVVHENITARVLGELQLQETSRQLQEQTRLLEERVEGGEEDLREGGRLGQ